MAGNLLFTTKPFFALQYQSDSSADIHITVQKRLFEEYVSSPIIYPLRVPITFNSNMLQINSTGKQFQYNIVSSANQKNKIRFFSLDLDTLEVGLYKLKAIIQQKGNMDSLIHEFRIVWKDMPRSLFNLRHAIEAMRYILTDAQLDSMLSGSPDEQQQKFHSFWKKKDPTPHTVWNELFVEYFRRVDDAFEKYRTVKTDNGAFTDRGRIHILFGPPENVERVLPLDGSPQEIWLYPSLNKKFIFIDPSRNGSYYLKAEEHL